MEKIMELWKTKNGTLFANTSRAVFKMCALVIVSFFLARAVLFEFMNPIMIAFLASFLGTKRKLYIIAAAMVMGVITRFEGILLLMGLSAIVLVVLAQMFVELSRIKPSNRTIRMVAGVSALFSGLLFAFLMNFGLFFVLMAVGKCVFAIVLAAQFEGFGDFYERFPKVRFIDNPRAIGLMIILGGVLAGAVDIYIGVFAIKYMMCALIILVVAQHGGASYAALCGVCLGAVLAFMGALDYMLMGVFSLGGITAGLFRSGGKKAMAPGFLFGAFVAALYLEPHIMSIYFILSCVGAVALFAVYPSGGFELGRINAKRSPSKSEADQLKTVIEKRLSKVSSSFKSMGQALESGSEKRQKLSQKELAQIVEDTASKACINCPNHDSCWKNNYFMMYHTSLRILESCERSQAFCIDDYAGPCTYIGYFSNWVSRQYDIYKLNLSWQNQMADAKRIMSQQLMGVAEIVEGLLNEVNQKETIKNEISKKIVNGFAKKDIEVRDVIILENNHGKYIVNLERATCRAKSRCFKEAARIVSQSIGRKMVPSKRTCNESYSPHAKCTLNFIEEPKFRIRSGAAYAKKDGQEFSGDCHSVMEIRGSQAILALSDGMGSGERAKAESEAAMGLLKDFLEAGFSRELALRLINSVLVLKDGSERFSTMDICAIDIHTGLAQFIKFGAASTFIKRGALVSQIASESLPMGILGEVDAEVCMHNVEGDDIIVMITDGVSDSGDINENTDYENNWVAGALANFDSKDPQDIADYLIKLAKARSGEEIKDDMTILCARVHSKSA